jgi:hypothetical protein
MAPAAGREEIGGRRGFVEALAGEEGIREDIEYGYLLRIGDVDDDFQN